MKLLVIVAAVLALGRPAGAEVLDYQPGHAEWNGLSQLTALAEARGLPLEAHGHLDWKDLDPERDVLVVVYPTDDLDPLEVVAWVRAGGRVLLADDFGKSDQVFLELGLRRKVVQGVRAARFHDENPALPVAEAWAESHPLARGAHELMTNHPAVLEVTRGRPDVIFGFGKGEAVVVAGSLGAGRFVALSDPSVLINGMLAFEGNLAFAGNLLDYLTPPEGKRGGRIVLLTHRFFLTGVPPDRLEGDLGLPVENARLRDLGRALAEMNSYLGDDQALRALGVLGGFALLLAGMAALPIQRRERLDGSWTRAAAGHARLDLDQLVARFDEARQGDSFALPAALAREHVEARLVALLGVPDPLGLPDDALCRQVRQRAGGAAATAVADLADRLRSLPSREQAQSLFQSRVVSRREFERVYDAVQALERALARD